MCYDDQAIPPNPPGDAGPAHGEDIVLKAADGNRFAAYIAHPERPGKAQILIFPDVRGLNQFYKELALRFAEVGITALVIDYFGRTAGLTSRDESFDFWPHVQQMSLPNFFTDVNAALAYLRTGEGAQSATFTVGFCMGGNLSFFSGTQDFGFAGADQGIPPEQVQEFDEALDKAGVEHKIIVYPGAPHSFFDRRATDFAEASADAWRQVLSFIAAHTS